MSDDLVERIKVDREVGTPGPWHEGKDADEDAGFGWFIGGGGYCRANVVGPIIHTEANARRIARVPDMEARILADADRIRELEAQVGRVTVKPLEWWEPSRDNNWSHGARTFFGTYYVGICGGRHNAWIELLHADQGIEQWDGPTRGSLTEAQADAQADYERRILSALSPAPADAQAALEARDKRVRDEALREAEKVISTLYMQNQDIVSQWNGAIDEASDAVFALIDADDKEP